jgi:hypothetical protein
MALAAERVGVSDPVAPESGRHRIIGSRVERDHAVVAVVAEFARHPWSGRLVGG